MNTTTVGTDGYHLCSLPPSHMCDATISFPKLHKKGKKNIRKFLGEDGLDKISRIKHLSGCDDLLGP